MIKVSCPECGWSKIAEQRNEYICEKCPGFVIMKLREPISDDLKKERYLKIGELNKK